MDNWEENQERGSMSTSSSLWLLASGLRLMWRNISRVCLLLPIAIGTYCILFLPSCKQDLSDDAIPEGFFADIIINLNLPEYIALRNDGGTANINGGVRGIILHRKSATTYLAFERNCSYHPNDACATVEAHSSNLFMIDTCCGSSFDFDEGLPTGGPAWRPLRLYKTYLSTSDLTITSQSSNGM